MSDLDLEDHDYKGLEFRFYDLDKVVAGHTVVNAHSAVIRGEILEGPPIGMHPLGFLLLHSSDLCLLFALCVHGEMSLRLLTFDADGANNKSVVMELPPEVNLENAVSATLDSYLGMVFIVTTYGQIISIPFA